MGWKLFIDDERFPAGDESLWVICRNFEEVQKEVNERGFPSFITFDHDLGDEVPTGYDITKWLVDELLDGRHELPEDFSFTVHSMNPIGARNISSYWDGFLRHHSPAALRNDF